MKIILPIAITLLGSFKLLAHDLSDPDGLHPHAHEKPPVGVAKPKSAPPQAAPFAMFAPAVKTRWDEKFLFIESKGLPAHNMMVGITAWQQQVPLPQNYTGANAWQLPLVPVPAREPATIRDRFLRGAIAIAANGIPIFNPQNNRGEISQEIGELDQWGGHCGRADDYHYHAAPLHLGKVLGPKLPIAYALDGYPIYGLTEPDGSQPQDLDPLNGHTTPALGYHYHASEKYPYVNGGFHGEVTEREGQVDPQPRATPVRESLQALKGARITGFENHGNADYKLTYTVGGEIGTIAYSILTSGTYQFNFTQGSGNKTTETYTPGEKRLPRDGANARPKVSEKPAAGDLPRSSNGTFLLTSPVVENMAELPKEFTGDGAGVSPPLAWKGAPSGTRSYALIMDHMDPKGEMKWYWTLYDIPGGVTSLRQGSQDVGKMGTGFRGKTGYEPPKSKGPGAKTYVITLYALSAPLQLNDPGSVNRETLLAAIKGKVLATSSLRVIHTSQGSDSPPARPERAIKTPKSPAVRDGAAKGGPSGLIKPTLDDTMKLNVYADNWFMLYINDRLVAVDPIEFTPHNVVSVDFLPEYPMNIAVLVKDNADPKTGMEYGTSIGDGGFILKFGDGTVTNATWKAKCFFHGPNNRDTKSPQVKTESLPERWWKTDFDDRTWPHAKEYTTTEVDPKQPYFDHDFKDARFIWTADLALDNTVVFRTRIEKPGWTPRWNTKPDLDVKAMEVRASGP